MTRHGAIAYTINDAARILRAGYDPDRRPDLVAMAAAVLPDRPLRFRCWGIGTTTDRSDICYLLCEWCWEFPVGAGHETAAYSRGRDWVVSVPGRGSRIAVAPTLEAAEDILFRRLRRRLRRARR